MAETAAAMSTFNMIGQAQLKQNAKSSKALEGLIMCETRQYHVCPSFKRQLFAVKHYKYERWLPVIEIADGFEFSDSE